MWNLIDAFLNDIAEDQGYERDTLSLVTELCSGGPTVFPDSDANKVDMEVTAGPNIHMPSGGYDSLGSKHIEYRVIHSVGTTKTQIPVVIYSFQHHPLVGCCKFAINRWVRCSDKWSNDLQKVGLNFRRAVANKYGYNTLVVSKGPSGNNKTGELYEEFDKLWAHQQQSLYGIKTV